MMKTILCGLCKHFRKGGACAAYPDGIPNEFLFGDDNHFTSRGDDGGVVFTPSDEQAAEAALDLGYKPAKSPLAA